MPAYWHNSGSPHLTSEVTADPQLALRALLVGGYGGAWVGPDHFTMPYASISLRAVGASAAVGVVWVLGSDACGLMETARLASYLASQSAGQCRTVPDSAGQCGPCVYGLPAIAGDLARLARGDTDATVLPRLARRLGEVEGRGACRHPDGAVSMVRSALAVFTADVVQHSGGTPCPHWSGPSRLRLPGTGAGVAP